MHRLLKRQLKSVFSENVKFSKEWNHFLELVEKTYEHYESGYRKKSDSLVDARKKLLQSQHLLQAQKLESIENLAGGVAHDFNNLLMGIQGSADILRQRVHDDELERYVDIILKSCARGSKLSGQLLGFARRQPAQRKPIDLNESLQEVHALLSRSFDKKILFRLKINPILPSIEGDPSQMVQTLINLVVNSRDAMPEGGVIRLESDTIEISDTEKTEEKKPGRYVCIRVSDTGNGIPKKLRDKIFDPFFTTKELGKGTGLGLSMVYGIVKSHKGFLEIESEENEGTTFSLYFPVRVPKNTEFEIQLDDSSTVRIYDSKNKPNLHGRTILVAEDEEALAEILSETLRIENVRTYHAADGGQAVEMFKKHKDEIDAVLLDISMPVLDGISVFREIRKINSSVPVVFLSGYAETKEVKKLREGGNVDFWMKPYKTTEVLSRLDKVFSRKAS